MFIESMMCIYIYACCVMTTVNLCYNYRLVIQRTKRVDETQELLLSMLEDFTSGGEEERAAFMTLCVQSLNKLKRSDLVTPVFIFERLCNIIRPVSAEIIYLTLFSLP